MVLSFTLVSCDLFDMNDSYDYDSNDYYPSTPSTPTYTYYFENYSSYAVTVTVGGVTGTIPVNDYRWIDLKATVTTFTYSPANLVRYTGALTNTIKFYNK